MAEDEVKIKLVVDDSNLDEAKGKLQETEDAGETTKILDSAKDGMGEDSWSDDIAGGAFGAQVGGTFGKMKGAGGAKNLMGKASGAMASPIGFIQGMAKNLGGNMGFIKSFAKFIPYVGMVIIALEMIPVIIEQMTKAGGPFDKRFKRMMSERTKCIFY